MGICDVLGGLTEGLRARRQERQGPMVGVGVVGVVVMGRLWEVFGRVVGGGMGVCGGMLVVSRCWQYVL